MTGRRVLLLHPPASPDRRYQLDGYCSQPQKGPFRWHPIEFTTFGARLAGQCDVEIRDLGTSRRDATFDTDAYAAVIGLIGAYGWNSHVSFWREFVLATRTPVFLSGDIARYDPETVFAAIPGLSGILPELSVPLTLERLLDGDGDIVNQPGFEPAAPIVPRNNFELGVQPFAAWQQDLYRLPFLAGRRFASIVTQVGCPHQCEYCILAPYRPAFRDLDDLAREVYQAGKHVRHIYVRDATLNSTPGHISSVINILGQSGLTWNAFARADGIAPFADSLAAAGCRVLQFGIDSPDATELAKRGKTIRCKSLADELAVVRRAGIRTVGHFVLGLETPPVSAAAIAAYASRLKLDWFTISPLMRRPGTELWRADLLGDRGQLEPAKSLSVTLAEAMFYGHPTRWRSVTVPTIWRTAKASVRNRLAASVRQTVPTR